MELPSFPDLGRSQRCGLANKELRDLADEALLHNIVNRKRLKSFAGNASSFASILFLPPFNLGCHLFRPHRWYSSKLCLGKAVRGGNQVGPSFPEQC